MIRRRIRRRVLRRAARRSAARGRRPRFGWAWLALMSVAAAFVACTLNPQPLPPLEGSRAGDDSNDASFGGEGGRNTAVPSPVQDASAELEGSVDGAIDDAGPDAPSDADGADADGG